MTDLPYWAVAIWLCGCIFLAARSLNNTRQVLNNFAPGKNFWGSTPFAEYGILYVRIRISGTNVDPEQLTDLGRQHLKRAIRDERVMMVWLVGGILLCIGLFTYFKGS